MTPTTVVAVFLTTTIFVKGCEEHVFLYVGHDHVTFPFEGVLDNNTLRDCCLNCAENHNCDAIRYDSDAAKCYLYTSRRPGSAPLPQVSTNKFFYWRFANDCTTGYRAINKTCVLTYLGENEDRTWSHAQRECENGGGILFIADSIEKREALKLIIPEVGNNSSAYVGAYMIEDGKWRWLDGTVVTGIEAGGCSTTPCCATIDLGNPVQSSLSSVSCSESKSFICEVPMRP